MLRSFWIGFILLVFSFRADAVDAVVSHTIFYLPDSFQHTTKPYVEVYWQISPQSLRFLKTDHHTWETKIRTDIIFSNDKGIVKEDHYLLETLPADTPVIAFTQTIIDMKRCMMDGGRLRMRLALTDMNDTEKKFIYADSFAAGTQDKAYFSQIELLDTFFASSQHTMFYKNGQQQIPLCAAFYDDKRNTLHYYIELYGTNSVKDLAPLSVNIFISKKAGENPVLKLTRTDSVRFWQQQPFAGSFSILQLPSGNYYLNFVLMDKDKLTLASKSIFFQRLNTRHTENSRQVSARSDTAFQPVTVLDLSKTFVMKYDLPQLKQILKMMQPTATPLEAQTISGFLKNPDDGYIRYFIYNHFQTVNPKDPDKAWKDFTNHIVEINSLFPEGNNPGYATDRGYVYLKYGKPDEMVEVENERGALPYVIWQYNNIEDKYKNAIFLFYRPQDMIQGYRLLHTTIPGETTNRNWRSFLYANGLSLVPDSKAEQYLGNR